MKTTNIDKRVKEKILEHEENSRVLKPEHWKNFEKQLDKQMPLAGKSNFWFTLNNILIVLTVMISVTLGPILLIHSSNADKPVINPQTISLANRNSKPVIVADPTVTDNKISAPQNTPPIYYTTISKGNEQKKDLDIKQNNVAQNENVKAKENNNEKQIAVVEAGNVTDMNKSVTIKKDLPYLALNTSKDTTTPDKTKNNSAIQNPDDKTAKNNKANLKHHRKNRKNILVPRLNYNGL